MTLWQREIMKAQYQLTYELNGEPYQRIPYSGSDPCRDCDVRTGQLHVPGCCIERCPKCNGQAISCDCNQEDEPAMMQCPYCPGMHYVADIDGCPLNPNRK